MCAREQHSKSLLFSIPSLLFFFLVDRWWGFLVDFVWVFVLVFFEIESCCVAMLRRLALNA
jgi:hypothetical protein